jgi:hypothetical protein
LNTGTRGLQLVQPSEYAISRVTLEDPPKDTFPVDFIALHGINGDLWETWKHEDGTLWLSDLIPVDLPGSRVWTYGYPADVFAGIHHGTLRNNARRLLEQIMTRTEVGQAFCQ